MALLHLMRGYSQKNEVSLFAATVNHGLRAEAAEEAAFVAAACAELDVPHEVLTWEGWDGSGNLQAEARHARYHLLADWAKRHALDNVALGHTADDQAETFLMRLARESGVDGLSAMEARRMVNGVRFVRPLLDVTRLQLRDHLRELGVGWIEDPSNEDERFDRVKARKVLTALAPLGIDAEILGGVVRNMQAVRRTLDVIACKFAQETVRFDQGDVLIDVAAYWPMSDEIRRRVLAQILRWLSSAEYSPRWLPLMKFEAALLLGKNATLHGCYATRKQDVIRITREAEAVKDTIAAPGEVWDSRWRVTGPETPGAEVRMLGEAGLKHCPDWRASALPRPSLLASPAVWRGETLLSAPLAGINNGWKAELSRAEGEFFESILSH